jgi:predicted ATPase/class 3 adenylate cyclase
MDKILTTRRSIEGERKLVTVLFADVADYTAISEKRDPEEVHGIMNGCFEILMDKIHNYEGTINQFTGDGVMALFGAPVSHEDHAQRACYAALAVQRAIVGFDAELKEKLDIDFKLRIGLNTGLVVVGSIGDDLRMDYTALGDTTNLAARMQQTAEDGTILIADSTYKLVSDHFVTKSLGELQVKGKTEPVPAYLLIRARGIRTRMDIAAERGLSPLVGRSEEVERLYRLWDLSKKGHGQVVFIVGEAGIGKSRLSFEFHRSLLSERISWLEGHTTPYGSNTPFLPLIDLLKRNFEIEEGDSEEIVIRKIDEGLDPLGKEAKESAPYLRFLLSVDPGDSLLHSMDAQGRRRMIFESIRLMTVLGSKLKPLILVLEDLHWIDRDSEDFLKYIMNTLPSLPVMLLLTYRPGYIHPFGERTFFNRISLKPLRDLESLDLTKEIIGVDQLPEFVEPLILERAEGNPLYVEEIIKSLEEMDAFKTVRTVEVTDDVDRIQIPMSIQDIIMARIDRLPEEQKVALQMAAVIGREFPYKLLEQIEEVKGTTTDALGHLVDTELLYQTQFYPDFSYMFKHALTHEVAYNNLLTSKRKAVHANIGEAMEELYSTRLTEYYETVAHHYERGNVWDKAIKYSILSGKKAIGNMANPSARLFFSKVRDISKQQTVKLLPQQEYEIYQGMGNTEFNMGLVDEAENNFLKAREVARRMGDQDKEAESLSMVGWNYVNAKKYERAVETYQEAIDFGREIANHAIEARNLMGLAVLKLALGEVRDADDFIEQAINIAKTIKSPPLLTQSISVKALLSLHCGTPDLEALDYIKEALPVLKSLQNARACVFLYLMLGYGEACKGEYTQSISSFQKGLEFAEATGEALNRAKLLNWLGWVYGDLECIDRAKNLNEESYESAIEIGSGSEEAQANAVVNLAVNAVSEGDYFGAKRMISELLQKAEADPGYLFTRHRWEVRQLCASGHISLSEDNLEEAKGHAQRALEIAEKTLNRRGMIGAQRLMAEISIAKGDFTEAKQRLSLALSDAKQTANPPHLWKTYYTFGRLCEAQDCGEKASEYYREACNIIDQVAVKLENHETRDTFLNSDGITKIRNSMH